MNQALLAHQGRLSNLLKNWLDIPVPQQFVPFGMFDAVAVLCSELQLPAPQLYAGNIVVGNLQAAKYLLSAHLDEASFIVSNRVGNRLTLSACHRYVSAPELSVSFVGIRDCKPVLLGEAVLTEENSAYHAECSGDIRIGDRAVYHCPVVVRENRVTGKAVDDRGGAIVALHAVAKMLREKLPVALVLSDGEQSLPDGYFSRTFPHVLRQLRSDCTIVFIDGIFLGHEQDFIPPEQLASALIVPCTGSGRGYVVPPLLFARLRDSIVPAAREQSINVQISSCYHSRGDDWGLVTNPTSGADHAAFFVSFAGWGGTPARRCFNLDSLLHCEAFLFYAVKVLLNQH